MNERRVYHNGCKRGAALIGCMVLCWAATVAWTAAADTDFLDARLKFFSAKDSYITQRTDALLVFRRNQKTALPAGPERAEADEVWQQTVRAAAQLMLRQGEFVSAFAGEASLEDEGVRAAQEEVEEAMAIVRIIAFSPDRDSGRDIMADAETLKNMWGGYRAVLHKMAGLAAAWEFEQLIGGHKNAFADETMRDDIIREIEEAKRYFDKSSFGDRVSSERATIGGNAALRRARLKATQLAGNAG